MTFGWVEPPDPLIPHMRHLRVSPCLLQRALAPKTGVSIGFAHMKIIIANRAYSSWSMRGWLAAKLSGLPFTTDIMPMDTPEWKSG